MISDKLDSAHPTVVIISKNLLIAHKIAGFVRLLSYFSTLGFLILEHIALIFLIAGNAGNLFQPPPYKGL